MLKRSLSEALPVFPLKLWLLGVETMAESAKLIPKRSLLLLDPDKEVGESFGTFSADIVVDAG